MKRARPSGLSSKSSKKSNLAANDDDSAVTMKPATKPEKECNEEEEEIQFNEEEEEVQFSDIFQLYETAIVENNIKLFHAIVHECDNTLQTLNKLPRNLHGIYGASLAKIAVLSDTPLFFDAAIERLEIGIEILDEIIPDCVFHATVHFDCEIARILLQKGQRILNSAETLLNGALQRFSKGARESSYNEIYRADYLASLDLIAEISDDLDIPIKLRIPHCKFALYNLLRWLDKDESEWAKLITAEFFFKNANLILEDDDPALYSLATNYLEKSLAIYEKLLFEHAEDETLILKIADICISFGVYAELTGRENYTDHYEKALLHFHDFVQRGFNLPEKFKAFVDEYNAQKEGSDDEGQ